MTRRLCCILVAGFTFAALASAQSGDEIYNRIARLSYIEGNVSFQHESDADWSAASINLPLEPGDRLYTGPEGRAEIQFDDGSACRLDRNTDVEFLSLNEDLIQIRVLSGISTLMVSGDLEFEINTPAAAFNAARPGTYRFTVFENGDADAAVRRGELQLANNSFSSRIKSGEIVHVGRAGNGRPEVSEYAGRDEWDEWNDRRNADMNSYANRSYLPDNVYAGASELNRYGRWINVESYGTAWTPYSVDEYWSPYTVGRWCYRPLWGWTWVSYEPWGWLPYHYGRWFYSSVFGWCWLPGPSWGFNFWSPGLVTFYSGPGWVSWIPLGPGDYYDFNRYYFNRRIYGYQVAQLRHLHTRAPGDLFNRYARGAFRTAPVDQFRNGSFEGGRNGRWDSVDQPWRHGTLVRDRLDIQPTMASYSAQPGRPAVSPRWNTTLPSVVRTNPAVAERNGRQFSRITNPRTVSSATRVWSKNRAESPRPASGNSRLDPGSAYQVTQPATRRGQATQSAPARTQGNAPERPSNPSRRIYRDSGPQRRQTPPAAAPTEPENFAPGARQNDSRSRQWASPIQRPAPLEPRQIDPRRPQIYNAPRQPENVTRPKVPAPARPSGGGSGGDPQNAPGNSRRGK